MTTEQDKAYAEMIGGTHLTEEERIYAVRS